MIFSTIPRVMLFLSLRVWEMLITRARVVILKVYFGPFSFFHLEFGVQEQFA